MFDITFNKRLKLFLKAALTSEENKFWKEQKKPAFVGFFLA